MMDYHRQHNVDIKIVRIFNTYGPRMAINDGRVVSNFIIQGLKGDDITVYGQGEQTRSFCYISDMISGLVTMMNKEDFIGPVNLGNPGEFTILSLAKKVIELTHSKSRIGFKSLPSDDPSRRRPDISLAKSKLGWAPKVEIDEGLERTISYFKQTVRFQLNG
jgi:UDP-glucuronate decarboxylase